MKSSRLTPIIQVYEHCKLHQSPVRLRLSQVLVGISLFADCLWWLSPLLLDFLCTSVVKKDMWFDWMLVDLSGLHIQCKTKWSSHCAHSNSYPKYLWRGAPSKTIRGVTVIIALRFPKSRTELLVFFFWFSTVYLSQCLCANIFFPD